MLKSITLIILNTMTGRWLPAHSSHQGLVSRMSLQLALQRWGASYEVAIMNETPVWGAAISLVLIISANALDSMSDCIKIWLNCKQLPPGISWKAYHVCWLLAFLCGLEIQGLFSVLPASWQPAVKATTPKCASGKAPGDSTALCADCLWTNVRKAVSGTYNCIMFP